MENSKNITADQLKLFILGRINFDPVLKDLRAGFISVQKLKCLYREKFKSEALEDYRKEVKIEKAVYGLKNNVAHIEKYRKSQYKSTKWAKLQLTVFERDNNQCRECSSKRFLNCHHRYYLRSRIVWDYPLSCFKTLCKECHNNFHNKINIKEMEYAKIDDLKISEDRADIISYDSEKPNMDKHYVMPEKKSKSKYHPKVSARDQALQSRYEKVMRTQL